MIEELNSLKEDDYKVFIKKLVNSKYEILGVRLPILRKLSKKYKLKDISKKPTFEEVMIESFIIGNIKDYDEFIIALKKFIPKIDNWSICDSSISSFKIIRKNKEKYLDFLKQYIDSKQEFEIRFIIVSLLDNYVEEEYLSYIFFFIDNVYKGYYYSDMAISWLLSQVYIKYEKETITYLKKSNLSNFILNKTLSKIRDSIKISKEEKENAKIVIKNIQDRL